MFPEAALSGYPWFNWWAATWDMDNNERINQLFIENSPMIGPDGGDLKPIMKCAREARVNVALPINERDNKGQYIEGVCSVVPVMKYNRVVSSCQCCL